MESESPNNPLSTLSPKLLYPFAALVGLLAIANIWGQSGKGGSEETRDDLLGRLQQTAEPWIDRMEKPVKAVGVVVDAGIGYTERVMESFDREPNGE
ncbi:MAG: hypothetical protein R3C09_20405 [Pirellulaceae bacterium]